MLAEFSVYALGQPHHLSKDVARMVEILKETGLHFEVGPLSTAIEGQWNEVLAAIRACHDAMLAVHGRAITRIMLDERREGEHRLAEMVDSVKKELARHKHDAELEC